MSCNWPITYNHYVPASSSWIEMMRGAKKVVEECAAVQPGETVVISTDTNKYRMAECLAAAVMNAGGTPVIVTILPPGAHGAQLPDPVVQAVAHSDVFFLPTSYSQTHTDARIQAIKNGARGATMCDITEDAFCTGAILDNFVECDELGHKIGALWDQATELRLTTPAGTDIKGIIKGRPVQYETGIIRKPRQFCAFPDSEVNISPIEGTAEGVIVADVRVMSVGHTREDPVKFIVKNGSVVDIQGGTNAEDARRLFAAFNDPTAYNIAEFAVGLNKKARLCASNLEDLGRLGNGHCGIGSNYAIGGKIKAPCHIDAMFKDCSMYLDGKLVLENGVFLG